MIDISRALAVPGHMGDDELRWLADQASRRKRIVEIGSYRGRSTTALCLGAAACGGHVWAVDHWEGDHTLADELEGKPKDWLWKEFCKNTEGLGNLQPMKMTSLEGAEHCQQFKATFDMVFIDASHDPDDVKADIQAWLPLVVPGGLICGHDFAPHSWRGVCDAVKALLPGYRLVGGNTTLWYKEM